MFEVLQCMLPRAHSCMQTSRCVVFRQRVLDWHLLQTHQQDYLLFQKQWTGKSRPTAGWLRLLHCLRCTSASHVVQTAAEEVTCFERGHHASHLSCGGACCSLLQTNLTSDWLLADPQDGNTCTLQWARVHCCTLCGHFRQSACEPWHCGEFVTVQHSRVETEQPA